MENDKKHLFDNSKNVKRLLRFLYGSCALLFILDFVIHRHVMHRWENLWAFYPIYGFVGCVVLVLVATWMRTFLMRPEDYYDSERNDSEGKEPEKKNDQEEIDLDKKGITKTGDHNVDA